MNRFALVAQCRTSAIRSCPNNLLYTSRSSTLYNGRRYFFNFLRSKPRGVKLDEVLFDKERVRYSGTISGFSADTLIFYAKTGCSLLAILIFVGFFIKGYAVLSRFSLATVARLGFTSGFLCCGLLYTVVIALVRRFKINPNAVYNQSIAIVMRNEKVVQHLGTHPRTGDFKAYSHSGGFRLPLIRRIRSGSYELADLLALKPRRMQMMFILRNHTNGREGLVTCEVRKETTGFLTSTNSFKSLSVTLTDTGRTTSPQTVVVIGRPEDVVYRGLMQLLDIMHRDVVKWNGIHSSRQLRLAYAQAQCPYNTSSENIKHKKNTSNAWFSSIVDNLHSLTNAPSNVGEAEQTYTSCTEEHVTSSGASPLAIATGPRVSAEEVPAACPAQCSAPCSIPTKTPIVTDADTVHIDAYSINGTDLIESHSGESSKVSIRKTLANEENQRFEDDQKSPQTDSAEDASLVFKEENKDTRSKLVESLHIDSYSELEKLIGSTVDRVYEKIQGTALKACALDSLNQGIIENFPRREIRPPTLERDKERDAELAIHLYGLKKQVETLKEMWDHEERERQRQSNASKDTPKTIRVEVFRAYESEPVPYKKKPFAPIRPSSLPVGNTSSRTSSSLTRSLNGTSWVSSSSVSTKITTMPSFKDESYSDDFE